MLRKACVTHPTHDSIFGDTYHGVPNPNVPHLHPYPTRYHGPILTYVEAGLPYREDIYARAPYAGFGADERSAGSYVAPAIIGGLFGYLISPTTQAQKTWAAVGAATTALAGVWGVVGTAALVLLSTRKG